MTSIGNQDKFLRFHPAGHVFACPCCKDHGVNVLEDGSRRCVLTGESFEATEEDGELFAIRKSYEESISALALKSGLPWTAIVEMPQPERQTLATSLELVDLYHKNRSGNPTASTIAVLPPANIEKSTIDGAVALLVARGWEIFSARAGTNCNPRTLWLKHSSTQS